MPRRKTEFTKGEYYHIYNRGANRNRIFYETQNYLFLLKKVQKYSTKYDISMISYCLMPNHYHFLIRQKADKTVQNFIQSTFNSYSKAFNRKYGRSGTLFEGRFKDVHVNHRNYLIHLCAYIHRNPLQSGITEKLGKWPFSNLLEWLDKRNGDLFEKSFRNHYFDSASAYLKFLKSYDPPEDFNKYLFK